MRWLPLFLLAGCMTDPNGDTCAWTPGNDGFCPSDSGGSKPKHTISYLSGTGVGQADHVRVAMTRTETGERPHIETAAVFPGVEPEHAPVLLDGEPMPGTIVPQLAAIGDGIYLAWADQYADVMVVAPLREGGTVIAEEIVNLGARTGALRRVGDRLLFVWLNEQTHELRGTWIDSDGRVVTTKLIATNVSAGVDISDDGEAGAITMMYPTFDKTTMKRGLAITRVAADGSFRETPVASFGERDGFTYLEIVGTSDGGALALLGLVRESKTIPSVLRLDPDGTPRVATTTVDAVIELVRNGDAVLALSPAGTTRTQARVLDEDGTVRSGPFVLDAAAASAFAVAGGFALVHASGDAPVVLTTLDPSGYPAPAVEIAQTEVDGCGCRSTNGNTAGLFVIVGALVLRRRRVRRAA